MQKKKIVHRKEKPKTSDRTRSEEPEANVSEVQQSITETLEIKYDPHKNSNALSIIKQPDGNYIGEMQINGKLKTTRQVSPESVLQYLLYHDE